MKKKIVLLAGIMAVVSMLTACGGSNDKAYLDGIKAKDYVKLGEYKGIEVTQAQPEVTEEYRDSYISYLLKMNPDRGVIDGDTVNINYVGTKDGVAFDGGTANGSNLTIGSGQFIPGFEEGLIGAKIGETKDLNLTFPENYKNADLAGKAVVFNVTINSIMAAEAQELTDAYVQTLGIECNTVAEYKEFVDKMLMEQEQLSYDQNVEMAISDAVITKCEFTKEPPQEMVDRYSETLTKNLTAEAQSYGKTLEEYMMLYFGMDASTYKEEMNNQGKKSAQQSIMFQAIADAENLNITDDELQSEMETMATDAGYDSVDEFKKIVDDKGYKEYMMIEKVMELLKENAVISDVEE